METAPPSVRWRIYYKDGTTVHSGQSSWSSAPSSNLVAVAWKAPKQPVRVELGTPYYFFDGHPWRCWDPTLYLRKLGTVKFGRWASDERFLEAWRNCLSVSSGKVIDGDHASIVGGLVCSTRPAEATDAEWQFGIFYDDSQLITGQDRKLWAQMPSDGVLCAYYWRKINDVIVSFAMRRFTYYYWKDDAMMNTDDLSEVLVQHPDFKSGLPSFSGSDYLAQASAIAEALRDQLEDVPSS